MKSLDTILLSSDVQANTAQKQIKLLLDTQNSFLLLHFSFVIVEESKCRLLDKLDIK